MQILGIIRQVDRVNKCFDMTTITLVEALTYTKPGGHTIVALDIDDATTFIDLSKLYAEQPVSNNNVTDWTSLVTYLESLSEELFARYEAYCLVPSRMETIINGVRTMVKTPFTSNLLNELNICSVENSFGIDVGYSSHLYPEQINSRGIKWFLQDLVFTHTQRKHLVDFNNTIPVVNGVVCYPYVINDKLYAYQGAKLATKVSELNKNIVLIDFSPIGKINKVKLSDCELESVTGLTETTIKTPPSNFGDTGVKYKDSIKVFNSTSISISFFLPVGMMTGYPVVCMFGRMFDPSYDDITVVSSLNKVKITIRLDRKQVETFVCANMQKFNKTLKNTSIVRADLNTYISNLFRDWDIPLGETAADRAADLYTDKTVGFVCMVQSNVPLVHNIIEPIQVLYPDKLQFPVGAGGLLVNKFTREIIDYVRIPYDNSTLVTFPPQVPLRITNNDNVTALTSARIGMRNHNRVHRDNHNTFAMLCSDVRRLDAYVLYDLAVAERLASEEQIEPMPVPELPENTPVAQPEILPVITRISAQAINVDGIEEIRKGNYHLVDITVSGTNRVWMLHNQTQPTRVDTIVAYDSNKRCWYIGTTNNHIYESNTANAGSSPWHGAVKWHKV